MKTDLLFSSYPFITSEKVTLTRISELGPVPAVGDPGGRGQPTGSGPRRPWLPPGSAPASCADGPALPEKRAVVLGIYPNGEDQRLAGNFRDHPGGPPGGLRHPGHHPPPGKSGAGPGLGGGEGRLRLPVPHHWRPAASRPMCCPSTTGRPTCSRGAASRREGTIREGFLWPDKGIVDLTLYSLLPSDWRKKGPQRAHVLPLNGPKKPKTDPKKPKKDPENHQKELSHRRDSSFFLFLGRSRFGEGVCGGGGGRA